MSKTYQQMKKDVMAGWATSGWLKKAIMELEDRDILDALNDTEMLAEMLTKKWAEIRGI